MASNWRDFTMFLCFTCIVIIVSGGCRTSGIKAGPGIVEETREWPPTPAKSRVRYVQDIRGSQDLGVKLSWWRKAVNIVTGWDRGQELFVRPFAISMDDPGNICLIDAGTASVYYYDLAGKTSRVWSRIGKERFQNPVSVAVKGDVIYVADSGLNKVVAFRRNGKIFFELGNVFQRPAGLMISSERLYVADSKAHVVKIFSTDGKYISEFGSWGTGPGEFNYPTHLATDIEGRIYVTDSMNCRIQIFDNNAGFLSQVGSAGDSSGHFARPKGIAVDRFGYIYVLDALFDNIQIFNNEGVFLLNIGGRGEGPGEFWMPTGITIGVNGTIYITDTYNKRLQVFEYIDY